MKTNKTKDIVKKMKRVVFASLIENGTIEGQHKQ